MSLPAVTHVSAQRDLLAIFVYLGERNLDAAERFLVAVEKDVALLSDMPRMGAMREFASKKLHGIRSWPISGFGDYLIFYRPTPAAIEILRVIHGARDINAIFRG